MPRGDRTGPAGLGPMTGRSAGFCAGINQAGFETSGFAQRQGPVIRGHRAGAGRGCGSGGRGFRNIYYATGQPAWSRFAGQQPMSHVEPQPEQSRQELVRQAQALQNELDLVNKQLADLSHENTEEQSQE